MAGAYGQHDGRVVDYELFTLDPPIIDPVTRTPLELRGPRPRSLDSGDYFVCIGGAQTFGRFCATPFPTLLRDRLGLDALNLGRGGAGPSFFSPENDVMMDYIGRARFAILQVMSGRSAGNSLFSCQGLGSYARRSDGSVVGADEAFDELLRERKRREVREIVAETRENWVRDFQSLLQAIDIPKVLFWFSVRKPAYIDRYRSRSSLFRDFPQLVNQKMIRRLQGGCDDYVACVSSRGLPQSLVDRFTGEPLAVRDPWAGEWRSNGYYPSPEMHAKAAAALEPVVRAYVEDGPVDATSSIRRVFNRLWS